MTPNAVSFCMDWLKDKTIWLVLMSLTFMISPESKNTSSINSSTLLPSTGMNAKTGTENVAVPQRTRKTPLSNYHGKNWTPPHTVLIMSRKFVLITTKNKKAMPLLQCTRTIDYTWTRTFFPTILASTLILVFLLASNFITDYVWQTPLHCKKTTWSQLFNYTYLK